MPLMTHKEEIPGQGLLKLIIKDIFTSPMESNHGNWKVTGLACRRLI